MRQVFTEQPEPAKAVTQTPKPAPALLTAEEIFITPPQESKPQPAKSQEANTPPQEPKSQQPKPQEANTPSQVPKSQPAAKQESSAVRSACLHVQQPHPPAPKKTAISTEKFMNICVSGTPAQIAAAIKTGVAVNAAYTKGITPLMAVARANTPTAVNVLLNAGASIKPKDQAGRTALDWAKTNPKLQGSRILKHL